VSGAERERRIPLAEAPAPGEIRLLEVGAHRIGLFQVDGALHALADRCPHRGAPLCSHGETATAIETRGGEPALGPAHAIVRCPWHKWDFEIATGRCSTDPRLRVKRYRVWTEDEAIVVSLDAA
jgi:3-phenylpropionate/trans-cinnamate dioxygenase ferredoxin subunit